MKCVSSQRFFAVLLCFLDWKMWSGLLPPGVNDSDVDLSSDDGDPADGPISCSAEDKVDEDVKGVQVSDFQTNRPESITESKSIPIAVADGENEYQECPSGVSLKIWNVGIISLSANYQYKILTYMFNVVWLIFI